MHVWRICRLRCSAPCRSAGWRAGRGVRIRTRCARCWPTWRSKPIGRIGATRWRGCCGPISPSGAAHLNLNQALANLRQAIGDRTRHAAVLRITRETIQFNRASDHDLDVAAFTDLLAACDQHPHRHPETCTSCAQRLQQAVDLYHGDFLASFFLRDSAAFEEWALLKRERLHRRALAALAQLADYHERRGAYAQAQHTPGANWNWIPGARKATGN